MISALTETTEVKESVPFRGWIFYDEDCGFCRNLALRLEQVFAKRGFYFELLQRQWVRDRLALTPPQALEEMRVLTADGQVYGGADAVIFLARQLWWAAPFAALARFAFIHVLVDRSYGWVATQRTCAQKLGGTCFRTSHSAANALPRRMGRAEARPSEYGWFGLLLLPLLGLGTKLFLPAWGFMWAMAFAIFFACKWITLGVALTRSKSASPFRAMAYLVAWPGMDAKRFLSPDLTPPVPISTTLKIAVVAIARILVGISLLFAIARRAHDPILTGWIGMVGMILILHFGLFA